MSEATMTSPDAPPLLLLGSSPGAMSEPPSDRLTPPEGVGLAAEVDTTPELGAPEEEDEEVEDEEVLAPGAAQSVVTLTKLLWAVREGGRAKTRGVPTGSVKESRTAMPLDQPICHMCAACMQRCWQQYPMALLQSQWLHVSGSESGVVLVAGPRKVEE